MEKLFNGIDAATFYAPDHRRRQELITDRDKGDIDGATTLENAEDGVVFKATRGTEPVATGHGEYRDGRDIGDYDATHR